MKRTENRFPEMRNGVRTALEPDALAYFEGRETVPYNLSTLIAELTENGSIVIGTSPAIDERMTDRVYPALYYRVVELFGVKPDSRDAKMIWDYFQSGDVLSGRESYWICLLYSTGRQLRIKQQWEAVFSGSISEQIIAMFGENSDRLTQMVDDQRQRMNSRRESGKYITFAGGGSRLSPNEQNDIAYLETLQLSKYTVTVGNLLEAVHKDLRELGEIVYDDDDEEQRSGFAEDVLDSILCDLRNYDLVWSASIDELRDATNDHEMELEGLVAEVDVEQIVGSAYASAYAETPDGQHELDIPNPFREQLFFSEERKQKYEETYPLFITRSQHEAWEASQPRS